MTVAGFNVRIYKVGRGVDLWRWLCRRCLEALKAEGWETRDSKDPADDTLKCDGEACRADRLAA